MSNKLINFFNKTAHKRDKWIQRNKYYNKQILRFLKFHIPENKTILEIGSGTGFLLNALQPRKGAGIDFSSEMINLAQEKYPHLNFLCADAHTYELKEKFDYIILSDTIGYFEDIQAILKNLRQNCTSKTRIIITSYNCFWEPLLRLAEFLRLKQKQPFTNWLSTNDIGNLFHLENFDVIKEEKEF